MKYWVFQNNQVTGPYHPDDLTQVPGYAGETLVCPEGRRGTNMGDWQRASMVPELSLSIIKAGQLAVALKGSGGYGSLPPEPTLKDLAALGSLQEKVSLLDNTVGHLQESLRLKDEELLSVHKELDDKTKYAQELSVKLGGLEERFSAVNQLREGLDKAVEAEHETEGLVEKQSKLIEDLSAQLKALRDEQRQMDELRAELSALKQKQEAERQETEKKLAEARQAADDAARKAAEAQTQALEAASRPMPSAPLGGPSLGSAPLGGPALESPSLGAPAPLGLKPEASAAERLGLPSERPAAAPLNLDAPAPLSPLGEAKPPMDPLGGASAGLSPLGEAKPLEPLGGGFDPTSFMAVPPAPEPASAAAPPSVVPEAPPPAPAKSKKPLALVGVAVVAVAALGAVKLGLVGGKKAAPVEMPAAPAADRTPLPPPAVEVPKTPTPEELAEQEKQAAIGMVKMQPLPNGTMVGPALESGAPAAGGLSPWMADKGKDGKYQVNFYSPKTDNNPAVTYEFDVSLADRKVSAHNKNAQALLAGKPLQADKPRKVAKSAKPKMPRIKPKKAAPADDTGLLQDLLSVDDEPASKTKSPKAAAKAAAAEGDGGGDVLIDGSGHDAQPQEIAAKPIRKAPKRVPEKRNVDKELNDLLSDDGSASAKKAAPPKEESLDELLAPGGARPGDAAPVAEPSAPSGDAADAAPAPAAEAPADADLPSPDEQASAPAPKKAGKAPKKKQPADAELLDDLLK
jgi:hypothetical protein